MTTAYSLSDTLSKDAGGQKLLMGVDVSTSQLDFALVGALGARSVSSKIIGHYAVGAAVVASAIQASAVGMPLLLGYLTNPSPLAIGGFQMARGAQPGYLYVVPPSATACVTSGSAETTSAASAVVYGMIVAAGSNVTAGGCVVLLDGGTSRAAVPLSAANFLAQLNFGPRGVGFGTSVRYERRNTTGDVTVTITMANDVSA